MPNVQMIYLSPSGRFRTHKAKLPPDFPGFARNYSDNQSHTLEEAPVFDVTSPRIITDLDDLLDPSMGPSPRIAEKQLCICEENNPWPVSTYPVLARDDLQLRQRKRDDHYEVGVQYASKQNIKEALDQRLATSAYIVGICVFALMALIAGVMFLNFKFNSPPPEAVAFLFLVGAVALPAPHRKPTLPNLRIARRAPAIYREQVFLYNCIDHTVHYFLAPYSALYERFGPATCRYVPDIRKYRLMGLFLLPAIGTSIIFGAVWGATQNPFLSVLAIFPPLIFLPLFGWAIGPSLMMGMNPTSRPFWLVYLWETEDGRVLAPIRHTHGHGVDPILFDEIKNEMLDEAIKEAQELGLEDIPEYRPTVNLAFDLHQNLDGRLEQEMNHIPNTIGEKLQVGSLLTMAVCSILVVLFVALALGE